MSFQHDDGCMADYYDPDHTLRSPYDEDVVHPDSLLSRLARAEEQKAAAEREIVALALSPSPTDFLDQTTNWRDQEGNVHLIVEMESRYIRNVMAFLLRNAKRYKIASEDSMFAFGHLVGGEMAMEDFDRALEEHMDQAPEEWMKETPIYHRFAEVLASRGD